MNYSTDRKPHGGAFIIYFIVAAGLILAGLAQDAHAGAAPSLYCENAQGNAATCMQVWHRDALPAINWETGGQSCRLIVDGNARGDSGPSGRYQLRGVDVVNGTNRITLDCGGSSLSTAFLVSATPTVYPQEAPPARGPRDSARPVQAPPARTHRRAVNPFIVHKGGRGHE